MTLLTNLVDNIVHDGYTLSNILRCQHEYHEKRRWSVYDLMKGRTLSQETLRDRAFLWHAARAELTTQPAGIRCALLGADYATELEDSNPLGAKVLHAAGAWCARYWLEEEAHHEVAYGMLLEMAGGEPISHNELVAHRGAFPADKYVRVCMLQACVEAEAVSNYGQCSRETHDPLVRDVFEHITRDEVQHRAYFIAFAKALVDSGVAPLKDVLSMAFTWIRPGVGETYGSKREKQESRDGFVNWWEHRIDDEDDPLAAWDDKETEGLLIAKTRESILAGVREVTGLDIQTVEQLKATYLNCLSDPDAYRPRHSVTA